MNVDQNFVRPIWSGHKLKLRSFMKAPTIAFSNGKTGTIACYPVLYLEYMAAYDPDRKPGFKETQFKINQKNLPQVIRFFREIMAWFTVDQYKELFIIDEKESKLMINMDYRNVFVQLGTTKYEAQALKAVPAVIEIDSIQHEGVALSINNTAYTAPMTDEEIETLYTILKDFSFQNEAMLLTTIATYAPIVSGDQNSYNSSKKVVW